MRDCKKIDNQTKKMEKTKASSKPHFFKPLVNPNFRNELIIPTTFFTRYLNNGEGCEKALLKTCVGKKLWEVEIKHGRMVDGWNDFVEDNDLHRGDILVFGYEGNCSFRVSIFDLTACERDYPHFDYSQHDDGGDDDDIDEACSVEEVEWSEFEPFKILKDKKVPEGIEKIENRKRKFEADATYLNNGNPYFVTTLMPSYVRFKRLRIPVDFSRRHSISSVKCPSVVIKDQSQRLWDVKISEKTKGRGDFYFRTGWHDFCVANHLKEGDSFIFELTKTGSKPTLQFHDNDDPKEIEKKENKKRRTEKIPRGFTITNGLSDENCNKTIILKNKNGRTWQVYLGCRRGQAYLGRGWADFALENKLRVGDEFKLELVTEEGILSMNYYGTAMAKRYRGSKAKASNFKGQETSCKFKKSCRSYTTGATFFCGTISGRNLTRNEMRFSEEFVRSNGLNDRKCNEMIKLRNTNGESWPVVLGKQKWNNEMAYLTRGWIDFTRDNEVKVGDRFKIEVVNNKEDDMLIMKYYDMS